MALDTIDLIGAVPGNADHHQHEKRDGSEEFAGADGHDGNVQLAAGAPCAREGADYKVRANSFKRSFDDRYFRTPGLRISAPSDGGWSRSRR